MYYRLRREGSLNITRSLQQHFEVGYVVFKIGAFYRGETEAVIKRLKIGLAANSNPGAGPEVFGIGQALNHQFTA